MERKIIDPFESKIYDDYCPQNVVPLCGYISSRLVAIAFGKNVEEVTKDISELSCSNEFKKLNFREVPNFWPELYQFSTEWVMTKCGFLFLIMTYKDSISIRYVEGFLTCIDRLWYVIAGVDFTLGTGSIYEANNPDEITDDFPFN